MKKALLATVAAIGLGTFMNSAWADIKIGVAIPATGPSAAIGAQIQHGAEMAVKNINDKGGIKGEKLVIEIVDDASDPKQAVSGANKLAGDGVQFVVAHYNSGAALPAATVYDENGMLAISAGVTNPKLTESGYPMQFRVCGRDDQQGSFAGEFIKKHVPDPKVMIIHDKTAYGIGIAEEVKKTLNKLGVTELSFDGVNVEDKDFSAIIAKMKQSGANVVYFGGLYTPAGLMLRQMAEQKVKPVYIGGDAFASNELAATAQDAVIGVMNTFNADPRGNKDNEELVKSFRANGFEPEAFTLYSYAVVQLMAEGITAEGQNPQKVAQYLKTKGPFKTVLGPLDFTEKGDPKEGGFVMNRWYKAPDGSYNYSEVKD
ncbi:branched-chain amino acid ABC transporter substrate-binding protein [Bartonella apis]|uniref:branched-chain amino acid ABC transporter substrate-binding protein n=1 Tax=Bartonella apis TaxID=1686310 RepID=UPI0039986DCA